MGVTTTIIPFQFDETAFKNEVVSQVSNGILKLEATTDLRFAVLETAGAVDVASDNFSDIFSDSDGLLNTVDEVNTTSQYDSTKKEYSDLVDVSVSIPDDRNGSESAFGYKSKKEHYLSGFFTHLLDPNVTVKLFINDIEQESQFIADATPLTGGYIYFAKPYKISENDVVRVTGARCYIHDSNDYPLNDYIEKETGLSVLYGRQTTSLIAKWMISELRNTEIHLNYNKAKPTALYFIPFSGNNSDDVGDTEIELFNGVTSLGVYQPFTIYNSLTLADTPDKMVIKQKNTNVSKINKFVLIIED